MRNNRGCRKANRVGEIKKTDFMNYFKQLTLAFLLLSIGSSLTAQGLAVKGGLNLANASVSTTNLDGQEVDLDTDSRTTFNIGLIADFPLGNVLSFRTGLVYQNRGFKQELSETFFGETFSSKTSFKLSYLDIPLTLRANFELGGLTLCLWRWISWSWNQWRD